MDEPFPSSEKQGRQPRRLWRLAILFVLVLGVCFRFANLEYKVYWFDEVATSIRLAGHTKDQVEAQFAQGGVIRAQALQHYATLQPGTTWQDTWNALKGSPEQAPLYYVLARGWTQCFGSSVLAIRTLSALLSLIALPCIYGLGLELFEAALPAQILVMLLSLSPFYVAYAQEARPYSLWTTTILLSCITVLRAIRLNTRGSWLWYGLSTALGFYTSLLSVFITLSHGFYLLMQKKRRLFPWLGAVAIASLLFTPWLWIILTRIDTLQTNTVWMRSPMQLSSMMAIWLAPILLTFGDLPFPTDAASVLQPGVIGGIFVAVLLLSLIFGAARFIYRTSEPRLWLFPLTLGLTLPAALMLLDLWQAGQSSASPRYMIPVQIAIQLIVAYLLAQKIGSSMARPQRRWSGVLAFVLAMGLLSCTRNLEKSPLYQKSRNLDNIPIANIVNAAHSPTLITEPFNALDLISLSYSLDPDTQVSSFTGDLAVLSRFDQTQALFVFNPSAQLRARLQAQQNVNIMPAYTPKLLIADQIALSLWSIEHRQDRLSQPTVP
jgi:uncharacterized membrane protein